MTYKVYTERYMCIIHIYVYIKRLKEEKRTQWQEKPFNGRLLKRQGESEYTENVAMDILRKKETKVMVCTAQEQKLCVNSIKHHVDGQDVSPIYKLCGKLRDTVMYFSSGCLCMPRNDIVGKHMHWLFLKNQRIPSYKK